MCDSSQNPRLLAFPDRHVDAKWDRLAALTAPCSRPHGRTPSLLNSYNAQLGWNGTAWRATKHAIVQEDTAFSPNPAFCNLGLVGIPAMSKRSSRLHRCWLRLLIAGIRLPPNVRVPSKRTFRTFPPAFQQTFPGPHCRRT